jgi:hypothetical protein
VNAIRAANCRFLAHENRCHHLARRRAWWNPLRWFDRAEPPCVYRDAPYLDPSRFAIVCSYRRMWPVESIVDLRSHYGEVLFDRRIGT